LAAAALALALAFAVGLTVAVGEVLGGIVKSIELVVRETEKLTGEAVGAVESVGRSDRRRVQS